MAFRKFKEYSLLKKINKELKSIPESRTPNSKKIHSVAILTSNDIFNEVDIVAQVKNNFDTVRNVHIYSFRNYKKTDEKTYKHFTEKDIDGRGRIKDTSFESFLESPFDLLIGYFDTNNLYLEYAAIKSQATFKVGFANVNDKIYDVLVSENPQNSQSFMEVSKKYLHLLDKI